MKNKLVIYIGIALAVVLSFSVQAQVYETPSYLSVKGNVLQGTSSFSSGTISLSQTDKTTPSGLEERNVSANLYLKLDLGEDYVNVLDATNNAFYVEVTVQITGGTPAITPVTKVIVINENSPEALHTINLLGNIASITGSNTLDVDVTAINIYDNPTTPLPAGLLKNYIDNNLRLSATLVREYAVNVRQPNGIMAGALNAPIVTFTNRLANFSWTPTGNTSYPNYELQILRLYNTDPTKKNVNNEIVAKINWADALKVETQSSATSIDLTIAEGTGFYVWRVRPIGNFYEGGIANHENYGIWSNNFANGSTQPIQLNAIGGATAANYGSIFYFQDPDENINWIYNRVFTEGNSNPLNTQGVKTSEGISYADGLLRARQTQAYNSSNDTTLVTQTISDYSGRPSLTTLPVPVDGGLIGYKTTFVKSSTSILYTALDFDDGANINDPTKIEDNGTAFSYYDGTNSNVADAEGFAFKRTLFKTDGTGRVDEESGVGKMHALGTQSGDGGGKTTRVLFGSPSDEELIRIFGDEAPLSESVIKTITIDPNGVTSATYTSKEGKTIATALITNEITDGAKTVLSALEQAISPLTVNNVANQNVLSNKKLVSSKRIALEEEKTITLDYSVVEGVEMGGCPSGDCNLKVRFFLIEVQSGTTYVSDADKNTADLDQFDLPGENLIFTSDWEWVDPTNTTTPPVVLNNSPYNQFILPEGEYIIMKEVFSANDENFAEVQTAELTDRLQPILDVLAAKMKAIETQADYDAFTEFYVGNSPTWGFVDYVNAYQATPNQSTSNDIYTHLGLTSYVNNAMFPEEFSFNDLDANGDPVPITNPFSPDPNEPTQNIMSFGLSCCGAMEIPVPKPEICEPCEATIEDGFSYNGIDYIRENSTLAGLTINTGSDWQAIQQLVGEHFMDYLYNKLDEDGFITAYDPNSPSTYNPSTDTDLQEVLDRFAPGFTPGSLQDMITNMLASKYWEGQSKEHSGTYYRAEEDANGALVFIDDQGVVTTTPSEYVAVTGINDGDKFNYDDCEALYKCWVNAVNLINAFDFDGDANVMDAFNDSEGNNASEDHYDDDESSDGPGGVVGWLANLVISIEMRNFQDGPDGEVPKSRLESLVNLPNIFVSCAGFKFANILDEDETLPTDYGSASSGGYSNIAYDVVIGASTSFLNHSNYTTPGLFLYNGTSFTQDLITCNSVPTPALQYKYIIKPEWMFKYFVYNAYDAFIQSTPPSPTNDDNAIILNQFNIEMASCYNDPNCGTSLPLCFGETCNYYHKSWSSGQRLAFYKQISGGLNCVPSSPPAFQPTTPPDVTKEDLIAKANQVLDDAVSICENRFGEIKSALIAELNNKCYTLVECTAVGSSTFEISELQIDNMAEAVVAACVSKINDPVTGIRVDLPTYNGSCSGGNTSLGYGCNKDNVSTAGSTANQYPTLVEEDCNWIASDGSCQTNTRQTVVLFAPCHLEILDQLAGWEFQPNIPVADLDEDPLTDDTDACCANHGMEEDPDCPAIEKEWVAGCTLQSPCSATQVCTHNNPEGNTYSTTTQITNPAP
tara:strand:+ start:12120 stop:16760 length:4641 start_codon:yes stop_codon:yes gene_type:complete